MSTIEDFENAPVGATATGPDGGIAFKTGRPAFEWKMFDAYWSHCDNRRSDELAGYTLNPTAPTTVREALDLAWELAHPVKEGQHIPEGTRLLDRSYRNDLSAYATQANITINARESLSIRTLDPLPEPEPDWLDAPAVKARVKGYPVLFTWIPVDGTQHHRWHSPVKGEGETYDWQELTDVTPLYPKEDQ